MKSRESVKICRKIRKAQDRLPGLVEKVERSRIKYHKTIALPRYMKNDPLDDWYAERAYRDARLSLEKVKQEIRVMQAEVGFCREIERRDRESSLRNLFRIRESNHRMMS